jgi:hypothetical protein
MQPSLNLEALPLAGQRHYLFLPFFFTFLLLFDPPLVLWSGDGVTKALTHHQ